MERTIDGIDFIAKSEVLRIIDEDMEHARIYTNDKHLNGQAAYGWVCRLRALQELRNRIANPEER